MNLFGKKKTDNWIIKLFKITDNKTAVQFDMENCILSVIDSITTFSNLKATDFDINYKDSIKTLNGFKKALKKQEEIVYSFVSFDSNNTNTFFAISNPMLNWTEQPENSAIDICLQVSSEYIKKKLIEQITESLIKDNNFEYGYITKLPSNYDSLTENKTKKGLFSKTTEINATNHAWTFHTVGILDGYIKNIYPVNYLNKSHLSDLETAKLISEFGIKENISDSISKWVLNSEEVNTLKKNEQIQNISIITADLEFLRTEKAKLFNAKMELNKENC